LSASAAPAIGCGREELIMIQGKTALVLALALTAASDSIVAAVKVRTQVIKEFDFTKARTWGWKTPDPGTVILSRTQADDVAAVRAQAEPVLREIASAQMPRRGFQESATAPDLTLTYYLLISLGASSQTLGQFLPAVAQWGVPPFAPVSTSVEIIEQGSLVFDILASDKVVWRGTGEAKIKMDLDRREREALLREAAEDILQRVPRRD
jgi:hypothetical protein